MIPGRQLNIFDVPLPNPDAILRVHPPANVADYALIAAETVAGERLVELAGRVMLGIVKCFGSVAMWEVRIALGARNQLANNGEESLDALGAVGVRLKLARVGDERAPRWAQFEIPCMHGNKHTIWTFPDQVGAFDALARKRRFQQQDEIWIAHQRARRISARRAARPSLATRTAP